jgi:hypothetical protein
MGLPFRGLPPTGLLTLSMVSAVLAGLLILELRDGPPHEPPVPTPPQQKTSLFVPSSRGPLRNQDDQYVATILARPLFSPNRRPPAAAPPGNHHASPELGRLTGVVVSPAGKSAIFAGTGGPEPIVLGEGAHIGEYVVRSIGTGTVVVTGPGGQRLLHPAFDPNPPPRPAPAAPPPAHPGRFMHVHQTSQ